MSRNWAIAIGINGYNPTSFRPLSYAKRDAELMGAFFREEAGFEEVWLYTDDSPVITVGDHTLATLPTYGNLISLLEDKFEAPFLEKGDNLWFFFAGHGGQHLNRDYLMPKDANPRALERTAIPVSYIRERLCRCGADNVILLLDACRTEGARDGGMGVETQPGVITISACGPTQRSWEIEALGQGAFTYALLEGLRLSGASNCATVERLSRYLDSRVPELCRKHQKAPEQNPRTAVDPAEKLHFILQNRLATLQDVASLKADVYRVAFETKWDLAEQLCIRAIAAASGTDRELLRLYARITSELDKPQTNASGSAQASGGRTTVPTQTPADSARSASPEVAAPNNPAPPVKKPVPLAPEPAALRIALATFKFETVKLNEQGKIVERKSLEARQFVEDLGDGVTLEMVAIPGGEFLMGAPNGEESSGDAERPQHQVRVPEFFMGRYAVTQAQWKRVAAMPKVRIDLNPEPSNFKGAKRPVEKVSWLDATEFCARLSRETGKQYRLPSEAEWEYACRAGTTTPFHFGPTISPEVANYDGNYTYGKGPKGKYPQQTTEVGNFPANAFGLYDMHGNVWEWCQDEWHDTYKNSPSDGSAWEENKNSNNQSPRLLRGGSWIFNPARCRSAYRHRFAPDIRYNHVGFRLVSSVSLPRT